MIRIAHVITDLDRGGAETMLAKLVCEMDRRRYENVVVSLRDQGALRPAIEEAGIPVYSLGLRRKRPSPRAALQLLRILKATKPTLVQSWLYHADFLTFLCSRLIGQVPLIWNLRCSDMDLRFYPWGTRWVLRWLVRWSGRVDLVIVNSHAGRRVHERLGYRARRWEVIPNGFDTERFRPDSSARETLLPTLGLSDDNILIANIARMDPMKDHATFLRAARLVRDSRDDVHFLVIGRDTELLHADIEQAGLQSCVHVLGQRSDVEHILPAVDIVCLSSAFGEGFPNVLGEAMACGVPCVATDVGDARNIIGETGIVVPPRNPVALADAWNELIEGGRSFRERLGMEARKRIEEKFEISSVVRQYEEAYEAFCNADAGSREWEGKSGTSVAHSLYKDE